MACQAVTFIIYDRQDAYCDNERCNPGVRALCQRQSGTLLPVLTHERGAAHFRLLHSVDIIVRHRSAYQIFQQISQSVVREFAWDVQLGFAVPGIRVLEVQMCGNESNKALYQQWLVWAIEDFVIYANAKRNPSIVCGGGVIRGMHGQK